MDAQANKIKNKVMCEINSFLMYIFSLMIDSCIKKLKNNKASGEDHIINEYIKSTSGLFLPIYEKIFNLIFETGFLPDIWLIGSIKPIYKNKGNPLDPKNFVQLPFLVVLANCLLLF